MAAVGVQSEQQRAARVCTTCRVRKKKCNKVVPICGYCKAKGLDCSYGTPRMRLQHQRRDPDSDSPPVVIGNASTASHSLTGGYRSTSSSVLGGNNTGGSIGDSGNTRSGVRSSDFLRVRFSHDRHSPARATSFPPTPPSSRSPSLWAEIAVTEAGVHQHVHRLIRSTGQFVDDVTARYFRTAHRFLPIIARSRFHDNLLSLGTAPAADFSALLLSMCLVTYSQEDGTNAGVERVNYFSLRLAVKSLLAQVQTMRNGHPPSVCFVQACLMVAAHDYVQGRPDEAFEVIGACARLAYAARIQDPKAHESRVQAAEASNTWWKLVIIERSICCDISVPDQPLLTCFPDGSTPLPVEADILDQIDILDESFIPRIPTSSLGSTELGGFRRAAQAASLLDKVRLAKFNMPNDTLKLTRLGSLDAAVQKFLAGLMDQCTGEGIFCGAIAVGIRTLFIIHEHILDILPSMFAEDVRDLLQGTQSLDEWTSTSLAALDTVTQMVFDIACSHEFIPSSHANNGLCPTFAYFVQAALRHVEGKATA